MTRIRLRSPTAWLGMILVLLAGCTGTVPSPPAEVAPDPALMAIRDLLIPYRNQPEPAPYELVSCPDQSPVSARVKHLLGQWIEAKITSEPADVPSDVIRRQILDALDAADLFRHPDDTPENMISDYQRSCSKAGYLGDLDIDVGQQTISLTIIIHLGGNDCTKDDSAYLFILESDHWQKVWQIEQPTDPSQPYDWQPIDRVETSYTFRPPYYRLVAAFGEISSCQGLSVEVDYSLWGVGGEDAAPHQLLRGSGFAGATEAPSLKARLDRDILQLEYVVDDPLDDSERTTVRTYQIDGAEVRRIDPLALDPRNFIAEWLNSDWADIQAWTAPARHPLGIRQAHDRLQKLKGSLSEYEPPARHCQARADLWQIEMVEGETFRARGRPLYFLVRWRPPYHFAMVDITRTPDPGCTEADPDADKPRSLFRDYYGG